MLNKLKRLEIYAPERHKLRLPVHSAFFTTLHFVTATRYCPFIHDYTRKFDSDCPFFLNELIAREWVEAHAVSGTTWRVWDMPTCAFVAYDCTILVTELWTYSPLLTFRPKLPERRKAPDLMAALQSAAPDSVQFIMAPRRVTPGNLPLRLRVSTPKRGSALRLWRARPIEDTSKQRLAVEPTLNLVRAANLLLSNANAA